MNIFILHITDMHFTQKSNVASKMKSLVQAVVNDLGLIKKIYIILSGDIAYSGIKQDYAKANNFLSVFKQMLTGELKDLEFKYLLVPGNHDCDFDRNTQLRKIALGNLSYNTIGEDNSVIDACLGVQTDFWEFYSKFNPIPEDKLYYLISDRIDGVDINFHCINTSWVSQYSEEPGKIFFPVSKYKVNSVKGINFGIWHHPYNWFNPNTHENNKTEFEGLTEHIASTHFLGHEHVQSLYVNENRNENRKVNLLSGEIFNDDKKVNRSGFQNLIVNIKDQTGLLKRYSWNGEIYVAGKEEEISLIKEDNKQFRLKQVFSKALIEVRIPLVFESKKDATLNDVFIFPDMESTKKDFNILDGYTDCRKIMDDEYDYCILDGESQVGKTSLLSMLYLNLLERGSYPLLLKGSEIKEPNIDKVITRAFRNQYEGKDTDLSKYLQLDKNKRVLLIDDYQDCDFNTSTTHGFFDDAKSKFGKLVVVLDNANNILASLKSIIKDAKYYSIKPLGYKKRNEMIERYLKLKQNSITYNEQNFVNEVKEVFDNVQSILGDKLIPPFPIYILSIVQALQYKPLKQNETSFGYCYQTLIHFGLHKAGVTNDDLDSYFNFLTEFAYELLKNDKEIISHGEMALFYAKYQARFLCPSYDVILGTLKKSKIIQSEQDGIKFGYNYILYYLSAKKLSDILHESEGKLILKKLFNNLHEEKNANILVFITHHTKDISFIESSILSTMMVLDSVAPITLEKTDPYYNDLSSFVQKIKSDIIDINRNPQEEREKQLERQDKLSREQEQEQLRESKERDSEEIKKAMLPFLQSFRSIEIVGQIIRNRKGSLEIAQLVDMLVELYTTAFRTIGYYGELLNRLKSDIVETINEKTKEGDTKRDIENKISDFIQLISLKMCLNIFSKLMYTAGSKELKKLYIEAAQKINTPAAKIVTFSINSYYGTINIKELSELVNEFKGNVVALRILKIRVRSYVYNRNLDFTTKQRLASALSMTLTPSVHISGKQK